MKADRRTLFAVTLVVAAIILAAFNYVRNGDDGGKINSVVQSTASSGAAAYERFKTPVRRYTVPAKTPNGKRVIITGGAGFIGSQLGYHLHQQGYDVVLIDNMVFGYEDNLVVDGQRFGTFIEADVLDERIYPVFEGVDCVFHFAALSALPICQSNPRRSTDVNVAGVASMLEAARIYGVRRFIFASTSAVYEENNEEVLREDLVVSPHLLYSLGKYQAEQLVKGMSKTYDMDTVILRFFNVFGPHQDFRRKSPPFTSYIVRELVNGRVPVLHSDGKQRRDYVYIDDLMDLATRAMEKPEAAGQIFNVASGKSYSVNEMYDIVAGHVGSKIRPVFHDAVSFWSAYPDMFKGARPIKKSILEKEVNKAVLGSNAKAKAILGWEPKVSMDDGLLNMINYVRSLDKKLQGKSFETAW
jgi:UDP-glucose 4-epimerase